MTKIPAEGSPPEAAGKGPGAEGAAEAQNSADTPLQAKNRPPPAFGLRAAVAAVSAAACLDVCKYEFYGFTRDVERHCVHKRDEGYVPSDIDVEPYVKRL